jgi:NADH-quinone oxidoreductase subunit L
MGGLRSSLPVTYWTFVIGALAIAGFPGLAGFFSKDEILFRTFAGGHVLLWAVGLLTSLLTAIYMFRLVFLAFHGERHVEHHANAENLANPENPENLENPDHSHSHLHDAPPAMALALIVLAVGSVIAGYAGLPHVLGGSNPFEHYLAPSFGEVDGGAAAPSGEETELVLMAVSSAVAIGGIALAAFFFLKRKEAARALAERFAGLHVLLTRKYYVDEIYDAVIVRPIQVVSERVLWKGVDALGFDGAVNGVGALVNGTSRVVRRAQTGSVRAYAASVMLGVVLILGYYLLR